MKKLTELLDELVDEASVAAQDAKSQNLDYMGFGRWGKHGKITHTTVGGKLVAKGDLVGMRQAKRPSSPKTPTTTDKKIVPLPGAKNQVHKNTPDIVRIPKNPNRFYGKAITEQTERDI